MARSRSIVIAGAGIGGLTAALALTRTGFRAVVLEQATRLEAAGAGIQLSPNATRVLFDLGLADRLRPHVVAPEAIRIIQGATGRDIVRIPLGTRVEDFAIHQHGLTVEARTAQGTRDEQGIALIGTDGLWSTLRTRLGDPTAPRFAQRTAWRAV